MNKKEKLSRKREMQLRRRRRGVILVMCEIIVCLILFIGCYGVKVLSSYKYDSLDPSVYKEDINNNKKKDGNDKKEDETKVVIQTSIVEETNIEGSVVGTKVQEIEVNIPVSGYRNILLLGLDARDMDNLEKDAQSDVMIIASINEDTGDIKMVSILRDTIMKMESGTSYHSYNKANAQFNTAGISATVSMINRNLGLDIDEYVIVNWKGVATIIDKMGGVTVTLENQKIVSYFNGYLTFVVNATGMWGQQLDGPGTYLMNGSQAVAYCRIRYGGYEDDGRASHHREVIEQLFDKAKVMIREGKFTQLIDIAQTGLSVVRTNLTLSNIIATIAELDTYNMAASSQFPLQYVSGEILGAYNKKYGIVDPMVAVDFESEVKKLHAFLFDDYSYEPSDFVKEISQQMYKDRTWKED